MRRTGLVVVALLAAVSTADARDKSSLTPAGWRSAGPVETFDKKTVWKAINGAAELYLTYGFTRLQLHRFSKGKLKVALHVYSLGSPLDALGVFLRERPEDAAAVKGAGAMSAFAAPGHCLSFRGSRYFRVQVSEGELTRVSCGQALAHAASAYKTSVDLPAELSLLPAKGRVSGSLGYTRQSFLGLRELTNSLHARYSVPGAKKKNELVRFIMLAGSDKEASAALERLAKKNWKQHKLGARTVWHRQVPYKGTVALVRIPGGFSGVAGAGSLKAAAKLLRGTNKKE